MYYTGVGSRLTPNHSQTQMKEIAKTLAGLKYTLRSGGAAGADTAFEEGCNLGNGKKEIYLPWKGFNNNTSELYQIDQKAFDIASQIHPAWKSLDLTVKKLHARNVYQILGKDLNTPSLFLICWTLDGKKIGGTRTAIVLAERYKIPIYNIANPLNMHVITRVGVGGLNPDILHTLNKEN